MSKTQKAIDMLNAAAKNGTDAYTAAAEVGNALNLGIYAEEALTPRTAGPDYYESHSREQKRAMFKIFTLLKTGKNRYGRCLATEYIGGFKPLTITEAAR
jgi:hypothetical protein